MTSSLQITWEEELMAEGNTAGEAEFGGDDKVRNAE